MYPHPPELRTANRWGSTRGRTPAYACSLAPEAPAWLPLPGCQSPRSGVPIPAVTSTTSPCLLFCCQLPSSPRFLTGTGLMLEARTSDQRRKCIRRGHRVKVTAGNSLSEADGARYLEFFLLYMWVDASQYFRVCMVGGLKVHFHVLEWETFS